MGIQSLAGPFTGRPRHHPTAPTAALRRSEDQPAKDSAACAWAPEPRFRLRDYTVGPVETHNFLPPRMSEQIWESIYEQTGSSWWSPRRSGRQELLNKTQGLLPTGLTSRRIDAGEALELLAPVGLWDLPRRRTGKNLTAESQSLLLVAVGQQPVVADPHEAA